MDDVELTFGGLLSNLLYPLTVLAVVGTVWVVAWSNSLQAQVIQDSRPGVVNSTVANIPPAQSPLAEPPAEPLAIP
ncbi:MAG: hypothetical protein M3O30_07305 [Planctomycetota bacterium]|nr:hypothetical protein [Planctomycetota bacterium]